MLVAKVRDDFLMRHLFAAGRIEMAHFKAGVTVETKADTTPVTIADHEAEAGGGQPEERDDRAEHDREHDRVAAEIGRVIERDPLVQELIDIFDAKLIDGSIRPVTG